MIQLCASLFDTTGVKNQSAATLLFGPLHYRTPRLVRAQGTIQRFSGHRPDRPAGEPVPG